MQTFENVELSVSEALAIINQTLEFALPTITVIGELANLKISKGKWLYFDLKDDNGVLRFFGTVYQLPGPLEDGMKIRVIGAPRLHPQFGFSVSVQSIIPAGEGSIKKAAQLLRAKLEKEGLFDEEKKRRLPYPPEKVFLISSVQSAAYADFVKVVTVRWPLAEIVACDVHVQGEQSVPDIIRALEQSNQHGVTGEVIVVTRGGGSPEDLVAFNDERLTRAIAASRLPTLVAIGHETDESLAELAADARASTPSNAAELLVPDKQHVLRVLELHKQSLDSYLDRLIKTRREQIAESRLQLTHIVKLFVARQREQLQQIADRLTMLNPSDVLRRGYALVSGRSGIVKTAKLARKETVLIVTFYDGDVKARVQ